MNIDISIKFFWQGILHEIVIDADCGEYLARVYRSEEEKDVMVEAGPVPDESMDILEKRIKFLMDSVYPSDMHA